jgi:hypothetical protein
LHTVRAAGATSGPLFCSAACRIHCAKSRPLGETITDHVSQPHYASCRASPLERITKPQIKPGHALGSPLYRALCAATKTPENPGRAARNFQQNRDLSGKQSQILSRSPTMQAVSPAPRNGSRRPRSSPATPSAAPCSARGSNKRRASRGSRGLAPLQSGNFQDLTRVDCRILVTLDCRILVTLDGKILVTETEGNPGTASHAATRARALAAR